MIIIFKYFFFFPPSIQALSPSKKKEKRKRKSFNLSVDDGNQLQVVLGVVISIGRESQEKVVRQQTGCMECGEKKNRRECVEKEKDRMVCVGMVMVMVMSRMVCCVVEGEGEGEGGMVDGMGRNLLGQIGGCGMLRMGNGGMKVVVMVLVMGLKKREWGNKEGGERREKQMEEVAGKKIEIDNWKTNIGRSFGLWEESLKRFRKGRERVSFLGCIFSHHSPFFSFLKKDKQITLPISIRHYLSQKI